MIDNLHLLLNKKILSIFKVVVVEHNVEYELDDTLIIQFEDGTMVQIVMDDGIIIRNASKMDIKICGEYDLANTSVELIVLASDINQEVFEIHTYTRIGYTFGSKFINKKGQFIFGFCYGFDEVIIISENQFLQMLGSYANHTISITN